MDEDEAQSKHRNPAIERMMLILSELEKAPGGLGLKRLAERTGVTRSTVYRILNSLEDHGIVRQVDGGAYVLGARLLSLADNVTAGVGREIAQAAQRHLDEVARTLGESCKISVYDRGFALVVAAAAGTQAHALHAPIGQYLPIHAGAGSKILMAGLPQEEREALLSRPLARFTEKTLHEPATLRPELDQVRERGWSEDCGEFALSVNAYGAAVLDANGKVVAGVSVPFVAGRDEGYREKVRTAAIQLGKRISTSLSHAPIRVI